MGKTFIYERFVEFADTDAAGIAHFTKIIQYMESAEHALLRSLELSVMPAANRPKLATLNHASHSQASETFDQFSWPRVKVSIDYTGPAYFEDILQIHVKILRLGRSSVSYDFVVQHQQSIEQPALPVAHGSFTTVCCKIKHQQPPESVEIPELLRSQLSQYLDSDVSV